MKSFLYGLIVGAVGAYLYATNGHYVESTLYQVLAWRNSAQSSVYGYGGQRQN